MLYLIPFLHQTTTLDWTFFHSTRCILFHFYIKPQLFPLLYIMLMVVSYSISTSNHNYQSVPSLAKAVVSYSISTSNHNCIRLINHACTVVSYSISTSNHNSKIASVIGKTLYLIPFLHQTTTVVLAMLHLLQLYLIPFLHQTTTAILSI